MGAGVGVVDWRLSLGCGGAEKSYCSSCNGIMHSTFVPKNGASGFRFWKRGSIGGREGFAERDFEFGSPLKVEAALASGLSVRELQKVRCRWPRKLSSRIVCSESIKKDSEQVVSSSDSLASSISGKARGGSRSGFFSWNIFQMLEGIADWADEQQERAMHQRRAFYKHEDWVRHRSAKRHIRHLLSSASSRVIISLLPPVVSFTCLAAILAAYNSMKLAGWLPSFAPLLHASSVPYELTAPALALLLVFRTEASYSRYDEGRKMWTNVISSTKDLSRQVMTFIQHPLDSNQKTDLLHYIMAFPISLKCHLIDNSDLEQDLKGFLDEDDLALVLSSEHRPNCLIMLMTLSLRRTQLNDSVRILMEANIVQFNLGISVCERLIRTPIPLSYTRLTSRILILWHLTLPVVLWDVCNWLVIPATLLSATTLFCIEEVGVLIEEPFPMLALDRMCAVVQQNIQELMNLHGVTEEHLIRKGAISRTGRIESNGLPSIPLT